MSKDSAPQQPSALGSNGTETCIMSANELSDEQIESLQESSGVCSRTPNGWLLGADIPHALKRFARSVIEADRSLRSPPEPDSVHQAGALPSAPAPVGAPSSPEALLPHGYLFAKCAMVVPLLQEARDALTALCETQRRIAHISPTLADRMDIAGTYSLDYWQASQNPPTVAGVQHEALSPDKPSDMTPPALPKAAEQAEPVAWLIRVQGNGCTNEYASVADHERRDGITDDEWKRRTVTPLYAAPQVNQAVPGEADSVDLADDIAGLYQTSRAHAYELMERSLADRYPGDPPEATDGVET